MIGKSGTKRFVSPHPDSVGGGAGIDSVANSDGSLTISPTTGAAVGSLNVGNANTWTADQTFNDSVKVTLGTGGDVDIFYDGTDVIIDAQVVGTGDVKITGDILPDADSTYNLGSDSVRWAQTFHDTTHGLSYRAGSSNLLGVSGTLTDDSSNDYTITGGILTNVAPQH